MPFSMLVRISPVMASELTVDQSTHELEIWDADRETQTSETDPPHFARDQGRTFLVREKNLMGSILILDRSVCQTPLKDSAAV